MENNKSGRFDIAREISSAKDRGRVRLVKILVDEMRIGIRETKLIFACRFRAPWHSVSLVPRPDIRFYHRLVRPLPLSGIEGARLSREIHGVSTQARQLCPRLPPGRKIERRERQRAGGKETDRARERNRKVGHSRTRRTEVGR